MRSRQAIYLYLIFFSAGFAILANAQRFPELQHQLNIGKGAFGTYVGLAATGSFIAFIYGSRIIHVFGIGKTLIFAPTGLYLCTGIIPHLHSSAIFILVNIFFGFFATLNHISINAQGIHSEKRIGKLLLPFLAGVWSFGALSTSILATFIAKYLSLCWHIDLVSAISWVLSIFAILNLRDDLMKPQEEYEAAPKVTLKSAFAPFRYLPAFTYGYILIVQAEFSTGDWSAIYAHDTLGTSVSQSAICFLFFMITMATFRMITHKINLKFSEAQLMRNVTRLGSTGFAIFLISATLTAKSNKTLALFFAVIAFIFLGFGSSFMVPLMFGIGTRKSKAMPGAVIAAIGLVSTTESIITRTIISWVAEATNLTIALMIPALMLFIGSKLSVFGDTSPKQIS